MVDQDFEALIEGLQLSPDVWQAGVIVGVSGGADSTALAILLSRWAEPRGIPLQAVVCDHGLRAEAAAEAEVVAARLKSLGIQASIVSLGVNPGTGVQERARAARYAALLDVARRTGAGVVAVGHHRLDQAETIAHRLESGGRSPAALAGMLPVRPLEDILLARPLLSCDPAALRSFLRQAGIPWVEDPSNQDVRYTRVRIRQALSNDPDRVAALLRLGTDHAASLATIRAEAESRLQRAAWRLHAGGASSLDLGLLGPDAAGAEAFRTVLLRASGRYPAISDEAILAHVARGVGSLAGTLTWKHAGRSWVAREPAHMEPPVPVRDWMAWDGRIRIARGAEPDCSIGPLGDRDASLLRRRAKGDMPHRALSVVPCLRRGDILVSVPDLGFGAEMDVRPVWRCCPHWAQGMADNPSAGHR